MDIPIYFKDQSCLVTIKINNKSCNDLLSSEMNSQFICSQFLPEHLFCGCHIAPQLTGTLEFFLGHSLTGDDVFDLHEVILI